MSVVQFPRENVSNIPAMARKFADDLESGKFGEVRTVILVIDSPSSLEVEHWGDCPTVFGGIGLLETGKGYLVKLLLG